MTNDGKIVPGVKVKVVGDRRSRFPGTISEEKKVYLGLEGTLLGAHKMVDSFLPCSFDTLGWYYTVEFPGGAQHQFRPWELEDTTEMAETPNPHDPTRTLRVRTWMLSKEEGHKPYDIDRDWSVYHNKEPQPPKFKLGDRVYWTVTVDNKEDLGMHTEGIYGIITDIRQVAISNFMVEGGTIYTILTEIGGKMMQKHEQDLHRDYLWDSEAIH